MEIMSHYFRQYESQYQLTNYLCRN